MRILITTINTEMSMNLVRYFKRLGHIVFGVGREEYGYSAGSLMVNGYAKVPEPSSPDYLDTIEHIIKTQNIDWFIPMDDLELYVVIRDGRELGCKTYLPSLDTISLFLDKCKCNRRMEELGLAVPQMWKDDNSSVRRILRPRLSITPRTSVERVSQRAAGLNVGSTNIGTKNTGICADGAGSGEGRSGISVGSWGSVSSSLYDKGVGVGVYDSRKCFLQTYVDGDSYTVDILCDPKGKPLYIVPRKRLEVEGGVSTKALIEKNEDLIAIVQTILSEYTIPGFSSMRFVKDDQGAYWFIEGKCHFSAGGGATLATCVNYLQSILRIMVDDSLRLRLNEDVGWNKVVTRYFEEMVYDA